MCKRRFPNRQRDISWIVSMVRRGFSNQVKMFPVSTLAYLNDGWIIGIEHSAYEPNVLVLFNENI